MPIGAPKEITECRRFFLEPQHPKQRQYEALRRYFVEGHPSKKVAAEFGYTEGSFRVLCHHFRRDPEPAFFLTPVRGPQNQPKKSAARATIELLRKRNHSVYENRPGAERARHAAQRHRRRRGVARARLRRAAPAP